MYDCICSFFYKEKVYEKLYERINSEDSSLWQDSVRLTTWDAISIFVVVLSFFHYFRYSFVSFILFQFGFPLLEFNNRILSLLEMCISKMLNITLNKKRYWNMNAKWFFLYVRITCKSYDARSSTISLFNSNKIRTNERRSERKRKKIACAAHLKAVNAVLFLNECVVTYLVLRLILFLAFSSCL